MSGFRVRKYDFNIAEFLQTQWHGGDVVKTSFFNALSSIIPKGEYYIIMSLREYIIGARKGTFHLTPDVMEEMESFVKQENHHKKIHETYNQTLQLKGIDIATSENRMQKFITNLDKSDAIRKCAITAAFEHFFCSLGIAVIKNSALLEGAHPEAKNLFLWHSLEEIEHCAVAYNLYNVISNNNYFLRINLYFRTIYIVCREVTRNAFIMIKKETGASKLVLWKRGLCYLFNPKGIFWSMIGNLLKYFSPGFNPLKNKNLYAGKLGLEKLEQNLDAYYSTFEPYNN